MKATDEQVAAAAEAIWRQEEILNTGNLSKYGDWPSLAVNYPGHANHYLLLAHAALEAVLEVEPLQKRIFDWARETFPKPNDIAAARGVWNHFNEEVDELVDALVNGGNVREEAADVMHLLFQIAEFGQFDLLEETERKFAINQQREWGVSDANGVVHHVKASEE